MARQVMVTTLSNEELYKVAKARALLPTRGRRAAERYPTIRDLLAIIDTRFYDLDDQYTTLSDEERATVEKVEQACFDVNPDYVAALVDIIKTRFPDLGDQ